MTTHLQQSETQHQTADVRRTAGVQAQHVAGQAQPTSPAAGRRTPNRTGARARMNSNQRKVHNRLSDALASIDTAARLAADLAQTETIPEPVQTALVEASAAIIRLRGAIDTVVTDREVTGPTGGAHG